MKSEDRLALSSIDHGEVKKLPDPAVPFNGARDARDHEGTYRIFNSSLNSDLATLALVSHDRFCPRGTRSPDCR